MSPFSAHGADNAVPFLTTSQAFVHYSLFVSMFALGAAAVFFLLTRERLPVQYRGVNITSALICGVAAVAYFFLTTQYSPGRPFPTDVRYVDWTVTTPLLLLKYPEMLRLKGFSLAWKLVLADLFMIVTGFIGELSGDTLDGHWALRAGESVSTHYLWGFISTLGYAVIVWLLLGEVRRLAETRPTPIRHGIRSMNLYILTLWGVYPVAYILEAISASHPGLNLDWANTAAAVADVINKAGFGLTAYLAVRALAGDDQESPARLPEDAGARAADARVQ